MMQSNTAALRDKLEASFARLQNLEIKPTLRNMELLTASLYDIRDVYKELEKEEAEDAPDTE